MDLVTPETMQQMDRRTIDDVGVPGPVLMDRAARGAVDALLAHFSIDDKAPIGIVCGTGNNGGDGLAMATMLAHRGYDPRVIVLGDNDRLSDDAALYFDIADQLIDDLIVADSDDRLADALADQPECAVWCDGLLGTGIDRPVEGRYATAVEFLDDQSAPVVAIDIPSGVEGTSGQILGGAADAALTVTFGYAKIGQCLEPGRSVCGRLEVVDIGIPREVRDEVGISATGLDRHWLSTQVSRRPANIHKGSVGATLHVGGRPSTAGAIAMSARAALVGGAGLITVATDRRSQAVIPMATPEIMSRDLFDVDAGTVDENGLRDAVDAADSIVIGPGLGTDKAARGIVDTVFDAVDNHNLIVDADGLNLIGADDELAEALTECSDDGSVVLTPHPGEMARLQKREIADVLSDPVDAARRLSDRFQAITILKTATSIIADADGRLAVNRTGNQGMATGGMGDALTGLIAAAFGDRSDGFDAACQATALHGHAADRAVESTGHRGLTVQRLLDEVPAVWHDLQG